MIEAAQFPPPRHIFGATFRLMSGMFLRISWRMKVIIAGRLLCSPASWAIVCRLRLRVVFGILLSAPKKLASRFREIIQG